EQELAYKEQQLHKDSADVLRKQEYNEQKAQELLMHERELKELKSTMAEKLRSLEQEYVSLQRQRKLLEVSAHEVAYHVDEVVKQEQHNITLEKVKLQHEGLAPAYTPQISMREESLATEHERLRL